MSKLWVDECGDGALQHISKAGWPSNFLGCFKWSQFIVNQQQHFIPTEENGIFANFGGLLRKMPPWEIPRSLVRASEVPPAALKHHHISQAMVRSVEKASDHCLLLVWRDKHPASTGKTHRIFCFPEKCCSIKDFRVYSFISSSQHKYKEHFAVRVWGFSAFSPPWIDLEDVSGWKEATQMNSPGFTSNNVFLPSRRTQNTRSRLSRRFLQGYKPMPEVPMHPQVTGLVVGLGESSAWVKIL